MLVWREKIVNNRTGEFIGSFTVLNHDERYKIVAVDQDGVTKLSSTSQVRSLLEKPPMFDDSITERNTEDRRDKTYNERDKSEFDGDNVHLNGD